MDKVSYTDAKARGLERYYTGAPCLHGHRAERSTDNRRCVECVLPEAKVTTPRKVAKPKPAVASRISTAALTRHDCPKCGHNVLFVGFTCLHCKKPLISDKPKRSKSAKPLFRDYETVAA
jgi:hypothetical protein